MSYAIPDAYICAVEVEKRRRAEAQVRPQIELVDPRTLAYLWTGRTEDPGVEDAAER